MSEITPSPKSNGADKADHRLKRVVPFITLLLVIATTVSILYFSHYYSSKIAELEAYGYLGAFLISLIFNATVILPAGNVLVISALGAVLPSAVLVGLAGGTGAAIGETTGYLAGYSGRGIAQKSKIYSRVEEWVRRWGVPTIFVFSLLPFLFDLAAIAAGVLRFPFWKFFLICWAGRTISYTVVALIGTWSWAAIGVLAFLALVLTLVSWAWKRRD